MAIIELGTDRLEELPATEVEDLLAEPGADTDATALGVSAARGSAAGLAGRLSGRCAAFLTVAWITIFTIGVALEPSAADEDALPLLGAVLVTGLLAGWVMMAAGFAQRRRYGAVGSLMAGGFLVAMTIACPMSGHHAGIGAWWWFEAAGSLALVGASGAALRTT